MAYYDEDQIFTALAIRNTSTQTSADSITGEFQAKTIVIQNSLNQAVTLQLQGSRDGVWFNIGASFDIAASTNEYRTVSDFFPKYRIQATCSVAPASGSLDAWILKART